MAIKIDDAAYPQSSSSEGVFGGLTKREIFAMHAMAAMLSNSALAEMYTAEGTADNAVEAADALIARLNEIGE